MSEREQKALQIAAKSKLTRKGDTWLVPSQAGPKKYTVDPNPQCPSCTCPDFEARQQTCKHMFAVQIVIEREYTNDGESETFVETVSVRKTYKQRWSSYNKAQTNEKADFQALLHDLCSGIQEPVQTFGRPRLPLADIIFSAVFKTFSTVSGRRFVTDLREAHGKGEHDDGARGGRGTTSPRPDRGAGLFTARRDGPPLPGRGTGPAGSPPMSCPGGVQSSECRNPSFG
jgi:hypothetical protein